VRSSERKLEHLKNLLERLPQPPSRETHGVSLGYHSEFSETVETEKNLELDLGESRRIGSVVLIPARIPGAVGDPTAYGFPLRFRVEQSETAKFENREILGDFTQSDFSDPGRLPVCIRAAGTSGRYVRLVVTKLNGRARQHFFALGELIVFDSDGRSLTTGMPENGAVKPTDSFGNAPLWLKRLTTDGISSLGMATGLEPSPTFGWRAIPSENRSETAWVSLDLGRPVAVDEIRIHPAQPRNFPAGVGYAFPQRFVVEGGVTPGFESPVTFFSSEKADYPNPGTSAVCFRIKRPPVRYLRVRATQLPVIKLQTQCALAEIEVFSEGKNVALGAAVTASSSDEQSPWGTAALTDGFNSEARLVDLQKWLAALSERRVLEQTQSQTQALLLGQRRSFALWVEAGLATLAVGAGLGALAFWWRTRVARQRDLQLLRQRIARDLHDEIGSNLGTIAMLSQMALETSPEDPQMRDDIRQIGTVANQSVDSMRDLVWLLKQDSAGRADFLAELRITAQSLLRGIQWEFAVDEAQVPTPLPFELRRNLFLAFKEILHNTAKHSGAHRVGIRLTAEGRNLLLTVQDDGCGFDPETARTGVGLPSIQARATSTGGRVFFESAPGQGTTVRFYIPLRGKP
jgi:signal transduction histidine kinase